MGSCGSRTSSIASSAEHKLHGRLWRAVSVAAVLTLLAACAQSIEFGSPPKIDRLADLTLGVSKKAEVQLALGEPRGHGVARLADGALRRAVGRGTDKRELWFYEFTKLEGRRINLKILLVFFDDDRYDGHLWFAAAEFLDVQR